MRMWICDNLTKRLAVVAGFIEDIEYAEGTRSTKGIRGVIGARVFVMVMATMMVVAMTVGMCVASGNISGRCGIRIRRCVELKVGPVCLGDVADIIGSDKSFRIQLENIIVGRLSRGDKGLLVGRSDISRVLSMAHISPASLDIYGSVSCKVSIKKITVKVADAATTHLGSLCSISSMGGIRGGNFVANAGQRDSKAGALVNNRYVGKKVSGDMAKKVGEIKTLRDRLFENIADALGLDRKRLSIQWRCNKAGFLDGDATDEKRFLIRRCGPITLGAVRFEIRDNTRPDKVKDGFGIERKVPAVMVSATVEYLCASVVATQSMPSGHVIKAGDVKLIPRRIYRLSDTGMSRVEDVIGQETARPIGINQVIMPSMIRKLRLVKRRDHVEVLSRVGNVIVTMQGIAQGEGGYGDMITVYNERTRKMLHARITGADSVLAVGDSNGGSVR